MPITESDLDLTPPPEPAADEPETEEDPHWYVLRLSDDTEWARFRLAETKPGAFALHAYAQRDSSELQRLNRIDAALKVVLHDKEEIDKFKQFVDGNNFGSTDADQMVAEMWGALLDRPTSGLAVPSDGSTDPTTGNDSPETGDSEPETPALTGYSL